MVQGPRGKEAALAFVLVVVKVADEVVVDVEDVRDDAVLLEAHGGELRVEGEGVAGLAVLGAVDGVALAKLDLAELMEFVRLPPDKRVVIWVRVRGDERPSPVDARAERFVVFLDPNDAFVERERCA